MRGKVVHFFGAHLPDGITPAHAGKSGNYSTGAASGKDHPRTCGEKASDTHTDCKASGSPPHMRGKVNGKGGASMKKRITPAHAGKSERQRNIRLLPADHPRTCGEKRVTLLRNASRDGITPAHAGKSGWCSTGAASGKDHPRTCGEKAYRNGLTSKSEGSPPHMRGKEICTYRIFAHNRITPAHAGKRIITFIQEILRRDHPRTCGEKICDWCCMCETQGSPPHMRGKAAPTVPATFPTGITPAHAGKRLKRSRSTVPHAAIVPLFPSVCNKPAGSDGSPAGHDAPPFLPIENTAPASPAYNLRSL